MGSRRSKTSALACEICILAGGLSRRMGRDKARLHLGRRTLLGMIKDTAGLTGLRVKVQRRDSVPRCGPLGGCLSALNRSRAGAILFLACDMPFVTLGILNRLVQDFERLDPSGGLFIWSTAGAGFPFMLRRSALPVLRNQIELGRFSLQSLAGALEAGAVRAPRVWLPALRNINTPEEWEKASRGTKTAPP